MPMAAITATITVTVTGVNDNPVATPIPAVTLADGQSLDGKPIDVSDFFGDVDGDVVTFTASGLPTGLSMDANGVITGKIAADASSGGPIYTVEVVALDGQGGRLVTAFNLTVTNPAPTAVNDTATTTEDVPLLNIDVLANDANPMATYCRSVRISRRRASPAQ